MNQILRKNNATRVRKRGPLE